MFALTFPSGKIIPDQD
uniref:Uncharacterized protein n=1 Tax=Arundo donax TaxID=35708 RepID=A0A0A8YX56_ARUDO